MSSGKAPPLKWRTCSKCEKRKRATMFSTSSARVCNPCKRSGSRATARALRLRNTYGITEAEYAEILERQAGKCGGCGQSRRYNLHVDHDHKVERALLAAGSDPQTAARHSVRGLLCARCNKVLRDTRDNAENLRSLAGYLENPPAKAVLA